MVSARSLVRTLAATSSLLLLAPAAAAGSRLSANCTGWEVQVETEYAADIKMSVVLQCLIDGQYVDFDAFNCQYFVPAGGLHTFGDIWTQEVPNGPCRAVADVMVVDVMGGSFGNHRETELFTCISARTPGYWKNHPEAWPEASLTLGSGADARSYSQACLLMLLDTPVRGDVRIILAKHLIAAKLNILSGMTPSMVVTDTVTLADAYLSPSLQDGCAAPFFSGSKPTGPAKQQGELLKDVLDLFNNNSL